LIWRLFNCLVTRWSCVSCGVTDVTRSQRTQFYITELTTRRTIWRYVISKLNVKYYLALYRGLSVSANYTWSSLIIIIKIYHLLYNLWTVYVGIWLLIIPELLRVIVCARFVQVSNCCWIKIEINFFPTDTKFLRYILPQYTKEILYK